MNFHNVQYVTNWVFIIGGTVGVIGGIGGGIGWSVKYILIPYLEHRATERKAAEVQVGQMAELMKAVARFTTQNGNTDPDNPTIRDDLHTIKEHLTAQDKRTDTLEDAQKRLEKKLDKHIAGSAK